MVVTTSVVVMVVFKRNVVILVRMVCISTNMHSMVIIVEKVKPQWQWIVCCKVLVVVHSLNNVYSVTTVVKVVISSVIAFNISVQMASKTCSLTMCSSKTWIAVFSRLQAISLALLVIVVLLVCKLFKLNLE